MDEEETTIEAQNKNNKYKRYFLYASIILNAMLLYYYIYKRETMQLVITGEHILIGLVIGAAIFYFINRNAEEAELPPKDVIAKEVAAWSVNNGLGLLDYTNCELERITEQTAKIYFPNAQKTFTYQAGKGVMGERWKDIEESLIDGERSKTITAFQKDLRQSDKIKKYLSDTGYEKK